MPLPHDFPKDARDRPVRYEEPTRHRPDPLSERGTRHPRVGWGRAFIPPKARMPAERLPEPGPLESQVGIYLSWAFIFAGGSMLLWRAVAFAWEMMGGPR